MARNKDVGSINMRYARRVDSYTLSVSPAFWRLKHVFKYIFVTVSHSMRLAPL